MLRASHRVACRPHGRAVAKGARHVCGAVVGHDAVSLAYQELAAVAKIETSLTVHRFSPTSLGLISTAPHAKGDVLMRVPRSAAIILDYERGLTMSPARWPRLRGGVSSNIEPLPWDILVALALVDGLAGDGGEFWQLYCDVLLPAPQLLTLPMCWEPHRLAQLQHADIANAAVAQQERLSGLLPELMEPLAPDVPSWFQWAFACVRSRAFRAGQEAFAFVPFLDLANHAAAPMAGTPQQARSAAPTANADFRVPGGSQSNVAASNASSSGGGSGGGEAFELVALRDIAAGEEVTICYSGPEGYTNLRFMAQYGFVPRGGNPADRVKLELEPEHETAPLDLARLQDLMGDALFLTALRGSDPYLFAALKSLPLTDAGDDTRLGAQQRGQQAGQSPSAAGSGDASVRTAQALLRQVQQQIAEGSTSLEQDQESLDGPGGEELLRADPRQAAAVAYRLERKRLLAKTAALLRAYCKGSAP